ncbi:ESX secretion-associated protein EspG [Actinoalloteichus hymeniacidonis]|uniref:EspG family n=1 Tax=Actinoalloteichus hymeniacidonis TaxID=340345 RepID=A0AAC9MX74_9PSEU|nr:ESX secretion-associated protein EspG [Actinoalloteichus hymeniacidonis]AOS61741.1 EspG family [Actinoalloteichus hymeniacidonis]MBB5910241.1 hypothetical protein [Actinoalloteichus hymeniacidonis]
MIDAAPLERHMTLSSTEFDVCWELLGLGESPVQLQLPSPGRTWAERREIVEHALAGLAQRELVRGREPIPELAATLELLVRHEWTVDAHLSLGRQVTAIGAVHGVSGALVVHSGDAVRLTALDGRRVVAAIVELLGDAPAAAGDSISVRADVLGTAARDAAGDPHRFAELLAAGGERPATARALARMAGAPIRLGQFGVGVALPSGGRRRASRVLAFHDTESGRHLQLRRRTESGDWLTMTPADNRKITAALQELIDETRSD